MTIYHEAAASARLDGCTQHAPTPEFDCCLAHALARIAELEGRRCETCARWCNFWGDTRHGVCEYLSQMMIDQNTPDWAQINLGGVSTPRTHGCPDGWRAKEQA